jgi:hypothetical protein
MTTADALSPERRDLLEALTAHRGLLIGTTEGLTDEQSNQRSTVSELTLGGIIKHVASTESGWVDFILNGPAAMGGGEIDWSNPDPKLLEEYANGFRMMPGETLASLLEQYAAVARRTDELVATLPDLDASHPLPPAPWFEPGATRSARRVFVHIVAETAQHAGHADIIREAIDGRKSMG